jgi:DegV family protein with EDD domain
MRLIEEGADAILSIHISSKLSGTYQSAWIARETLPDGVKKIPIELVDSQSASIGMTPAILQAAREAREGLGLEEIKAHLLDMLSRTQFLGVLDTLEFVKRSGRLNGAIALLGNMLNVKPILALKDGEIIPVGVSSTRNRAYAHITRQVAAMGKVEQMIAGESSPGTGQRLIDGLKAVYQGDIPLYQLGAVLGTHTGPGTAAVAVVTEILS